MDKSKDKVPYAVGDEIYLMEYASAVLKYKYLIVLFAFLIGSSAYGLSYLMPEMYEAYTQIAIVENDDPGDVLPDNRSAPEVLTLVEEGFVMGRIRENYRDIIMAKMRSRIFTIKFIKDNGILHHIFEKHWDDKLKKWKNEFKPDINLAYKIFNTSIRFVDYNKDTDLLSVRIRHNDPELAAKWTNLYVKKFNKFMRENAINDVHKKMIFLQKELERTDIVEMQKSIYRLIEAQTAIEMLANSKEEYTLEVLDPAIVPVYKFSPKRKNIALLSFVGTLMFGFTFSIGRVMFGKIKNALNTYSHSMDNMQIETKYEIKVKSSKLSHGVKGCIMKLS